MLSTWDAILSKAGSLNAEMIMLKPRSVVPLTLYIVDLIFADLDRKT